MNESEKQDRLRDLFNEAAEITGDVERAAFLERTCSDDAGLRQRLDKLLKAHADAGGFMGAPGGTTILPITEKPGDRIGRYKLLQQIGEGGCGAVYMAEQEEPVRRRVALKVIKLGMDTKSVIARFEAERQALALMDHPNIAKVLDAGATDAGRPYFVMELVKGLRITEYCDQNNLPTAARLDLFTQVCHAIQHAHQKGIIHRDIKPSNILVTMHDGVPVPKVIDFGIAKATDQRLTDKTLFTAFEQLMGTPAYMSPEQAEMRGLDIDTRSDIYALGVLLYELLTGKTPFDAHDLIASGLEAMRRTIREQEPARPSTRLSTMLATDLTIVAKHRQCESGKLTNSLRGDLDWIVMKALEKDRTRRYDTANGLAQDIARHLNNEPIVARPPTQIYRFQKMVRRNKLAFAAASAVLVALILGLGVSTWMFFHEKQARQRAVAAERNAKTEASKSQQVAQFLKEMLQGVGPSVALGRDTKMLREILDKTSERVSKDLKDQPGVEFELRNTIGEVYYALGDYEKAETMERKALAMSRKSLGSEPVSDALDALGQVLGRQGNLSEAETMIREALAMRRKLFGNEHTSVALSLESLANVLSGQGKLAEAETMYREALTMQRKLLGNEHREVATSLDNLGLVLRREGKLAEAETIQREGLGMDRKLLGNEHPDVAIALWSLGQVLDNQAKLAEAEAMFREALAMQKKLLGNEHPDVASSLGSLARVLHQQGKPAEAEAMFREALAMQKKLLGNENTSVAASLNNLAALLSEQGKKSEAEAMLREALAMQKKLLGNEHPSVAASLDNLGALLSEQSKKSEAETMHRETLAMRRKLLGNEHPDVAASLNNLAAVLMSQSKLAEAETMFREALAMQRKLLGNEHPDLANSLNNLAVLLERESKLVEAETMHGEALAMRRKLLGNEHPQVANSVINLAAVLMSQGKLAEAETMNREALAMTRKLLGNEHPQVAHSLNNLAAVLWRQGKWSETESLLREALAMEIKLLGNEHPDVARSLKSLASMLWREGKLAKAEAMNREALVMRRKLLGNEHPDVADSLNDLSNVLQDQGRLAEAEALDREALAISRKSGTKEPRYLERSLRTMAEILYRQARYAEAEPLFRECLQSQLSHDTAPDDKVFITASLGRLLADWAWAERAGSADFSPIRSDGGSEGKRTEVRAPREMAREAERLLRDCLASRLRGTNPMPWRTADVRSRLGGALLIVAITDADLSSEARLAKLTEGEALLLEGNKGLHQDPDAESKYKRDAIERLARLYEASGKPDKLAEWKQKLADFDKAETEKQIVVSKP